MIVHVYNFYKIDRGGVSMRNFKILSTLFIVSALFLTLNSYSFAADAEAVGDSSTGAAVRTENTVNTANSAARVSDGAENASVKNEKSGECPKKAGKAFGKRSVFGKIFGFFEGLFDKAVGFFKKIGSALGFKGCENPEKTAQANDDNNSSANGETAASNNTETPSNDSPANNTSSTGTNNDTSIAAVSENLADGSTANADNEASSATGVTGTSTASNSSVNGESVPASTTPGTSTAVSTTSTAAGATPSTPAASSNSDETQTPQAANDTSTPAVSNTENNTQTPTAANSAENNAENNTGTVDVSSNAGVTGTIPERAAGSQGGSAFMAKVNSMSLTNYDKAVLDEITRGNVPDFLKNFKEVKVNFKTKDGKEHTASYYAMPDYLAIGSNDDFVRVPMTPMAAQKIAEMYGCQLPTKKMVDDIYSQATVKLNPQPISVDKGISKISNFAEHQKMVEKQRAGQPLGALTAGDKKDVVITNLLDQAAAKGKKQVAIYGWHQKNGKAIQPLSTIHNYYHVDYSHGIRLIKDTMVVDGKTVKVADVLKDAELSKAISYEGTIKNTKAHR